MDSKLSSPNYNRTIPPRRMDPDAVLVMWECVNHVIDEMRTESESQTNSLQRRDAAKINLDDLLIQRRIFWEDRSEVLKARGVVEPVDL